MERALEAKRLKDRGMSWREVGQRMGVSKARAHQLGKAGASIHAKRTARGAL